jgi:HEAT repeat protein
MQDGRSLYLALDDELIAADDALAPLGHAARDASTWALRLDACHALGAIAGRAFGASWETAEKAAFALLEVAGETDAPIERAQLLGAIARGFRNLWLMPYVHARLGDGDARVVAAAITAAGGLAFPALEEVLASTFLATDASPALRLAAISALGRMGAESAASRIVPFVDGAAAEAIAALDALTEIRSRAGADAAIAVLDREPAPDVVASAVRYLAEIGHERVLRALRRLARAGDPQQRIAASLASRAYATERLGDPAERILAALTERDRAVRATLARRLRTLPVAGVIEQASLLLSDDPEGVVQIVAEVRAPEVTRFLLSIANDPSQSIAVRARAAGSIEANEAWEQAALIELVTSARDVAVRVAATQTLGAFAAPSLVIDRLADLASDRAPAMRAAMLWALQLAARPGSLAGAERARAEAIVQGALRDEDPSVRRRAAYVAGNVDARALVPDLIELARSEPEREELRVAAFVGAAEVGADARLPDLVQLFLREEKPAALGAAARAIERACEHEAVDRAALMRTKDRLPKLRAHADARARAAAARLAGLVPGALPVEAVVAMIDDVSPRVREQAVVALGRIGLRDADRAVCAKGLVHALGDTDAVIQEVAAGALLALGDATSVAQVLDLVARTPDEQAAVRIAEAITPPSGDPAAFVDALTAALARIGDAHAAYETLLELKVRALDAARPSSASRPRPNVDAEIATHFPAWPRLSIVRGFLPLAKSLRTAEMLYGSTATADADQSASIVLWTKSLEGYLHAWLAPRLASLQRQPSSLFEVTDRVGAAWPSYQRWLVTRWADPVNVGGMNVEVPLRSTVNVLRDLSERRVKSLDSPLSVTEWARMMMFLAVDHPSGAKNLLQVSCTDADQAVRLAHRLQVIALVRNAVTHRSVAATSTLDAFRTLYYGAFEDVTRIA